MWERLNRGRELLAFTDGLIFRATPHGSTSFQFSRPSAVGRCTTLIFAHTAQNVLLLRIVSSPRLDYLTNQKHPIHDAYEGQHVQS